MIKQYKISFNIWALFLFILIMIPNLIWFAVPAPNDVLRADSSTELLDKVASISQVTMILFLCMIVNKQSEKMKTSFLTIAMGICCLVYFSMWIFYYKGIVTALIILLLCLTPCLAFLFMAIDRKNMIAVIPTVIFTICHLVYGIVNYIL